MQSIAKNSKIAIYNTNNNINKMVKSIISRWESPTEKKLNVWKPVWSSTNDQVTTLITWNGWKRNPKLIKDDLRRLSDNEIIDLVINEWTYVHIVEKQSEALYKLFLERLTACETKVIKKIFWNTFFIDNLNKFSTWKKFLFSLFESWILEQTLFSPHYQNTLIKIDINKYIENLDKNQKLILKILPVSWNMRNVKQKIEENQRVALYDLINFSWILSGILKLQIHPEKLLLIKKANNFTAILQNEYSKLKEEEKIFLFKNIAFLKTIHSDIKLIEVFSKYFHWIQNKEWFPKHTQMFWRKKED